MSLFDMFTVSKSKEKALNSSRLYQLCNTIYGRYSYQSAVSPGEYLMLLSRASMAGGRKSAR